MNFDDTAEEAAFRAAARAWLERNAEPRRPGEPALGYELGEAELVRRAKAWQARKAEAGYAAITLPVAVGGRGGTPIEAVIWQQEESRFRVPFGVYEITLGMCIPTVAVFGSPEQVARWVRPAIGGGTVWCQLFSEPGAGSDLAGLRTRARREGDVWIVDGQKVWTTGAQFSDWGLLLARSDPEKPKHKGLTMLVVDMRSPGVTVRPLKQMSGESEFNEVFFDAVRVPDGNRIGDVDSGWTVALGTLMHERLSVGSGTGLIDAGVALALAKRPSASGERPIDDPRVRERLARWHIVTQGARLIAQRGLTALSKGEVPGPEQSILKTLSAVQAQEIAEFAYELAGERGLLGAELLGEGWADIERSWMQAAAMRIAGGTDEILRNVIAERVLGLPGDVRLDKDRPFSAL